MMTEATSTRDGTDGRGTSDGVAARGFVNGRGPRLSMGGIAPTGAYRPEVPRPQTTKGLVYYKVRKNPKAPNRQLSGLEP